jgi:integrase
MRSLFKFAYQIGYVDQPLRFSDALKAPAARLLRKSKLLKSTRIFSPEEIHLLIKNASGYMKPAIWLAINCGFGNTDVCNLQWSNIEGEWVEMVRAKTYVSRAGYLWPETIDALDTWRREGPVSKWVVCGRKGHKFGGENGSTPIAHLFADLANECGVTGRGFYAIRHTYRTIADGCKDQPAVMLTMGHADSSISNEYRHGIEESRLIAVANYVGGWLREPAGRGDGGIKLRG